MAKNKRLANFVMDFIKRKVSPPVFMVVGGGAMYLNDAVRQSGLKYVCYHHEQAAAIAAEGFYRTSGRLAVVNVTSGPGCLNTLTGVMGQ